MMAGSGGRGVVIGVGTLLVIGLVVLGLLALCAWIVFRQ
jgi:hypothetical protein